MANLEFLGDKKNLLRKKVVIPVAISAVILLSIGFSMGNSSANTELNGQKMKHEEISKEIKSAKKDLKTYEVKVVEIQSKIKYVQTEYAENKTEFDAAKKIADEIDGTKGQLDTLNNDIETKKTESSSLDAEIKKKKDELAKIENVIVVKNEAPIRLPAGHFLVGKDIEPGRYKVVAVGQGSNFMVDDLEGNNVVNTIIYSSPEDGGVTEYITDLNDGDTINAESPFKYIPVE
jgi:hypothetical protein